jgi:hypothetical protein
MWLDPIPDSLRGLALANLDDGDVIGFLVRASNEYSLDLVRFNRLALKERGLYEPALLHAFTSTRVNNHRWPMNELRYLFRSADPARLRAAGDPIPPGPFTLYRGVAGRGPARRIRSFSWTASLERAWWFARRFPDLYDPGVYTVTVGEDSILACVDDRKEQEFIVDVPQTAKPVRVSEGQAERKGA